MKLAVPATLVALLTAGAVASATSTAPASTAVQPALVTQASAVPAVRDDTLERTTRLLPSGRAPLVAAGGDAEAGQSKQAAAKEAAEAQQKAAEAKAARKKAAEKKADQKAADKKAAEKKAADKKAEQKKKAAAKANTPTAAQLRVKGERYTRVSLSVRTQPKSSADLVTVLKSGSKLKVTDTTRGAWTLVIHRSKGRWVHSEYLVKKKPAKKSSSSGSGGLSMARCSSGSSMESGLTKDAVRVHRAVCARFPSIKSYGGMRSGGGSYHSSGRAVDIMVSGSKGQDVADWVRANRKQLGVSEIIYAQKIWTVQRGSEGWRSMSSRGNATANHYDHVHVSVYGNSATG